MKNTILSILALVSLTLVSSCNKNQDVEGCTDSTADNYNSAATLDDGSCTYTIPSNPTCDGHDTNTDLFPLIQGTQWRYDQVGTSQDYYVEITGTTDINSVTYITADWSQFGGNITGTKKYRVDTNGDVYYRSGANDYMEIPANPTVGQSWVDEYTVTHQVVDVNASLTTSTCSYSGCVKILNDYTNTPDTYTYYKAGIGMIKSEDFTLKDLQF